MIWELASLLLGAAIGWATSWVFERRSARSEHERHLETVRQNELLQQRIHELEQSQSTMQSHMREGFASSARTTQAPRREPSAQTLDAQEVLTELRARLGVDGTARLGALRSVFLARGCTSQMFDDTLNELIHTGVIRLEGKVLQFT